MEKCDYPKCIFYRLETILFQLKDTYKHYFKVIFAQKEKPKKNSVFHHNHGLTPLENIQKCDHLKSKFSKVKKLFFSVEKILRLYFMIIFAQKQKM